MLPTGRNISFIICSIISTISLASAAATSEGCFAGDSSLSAPIAYDYQSQGYCMNLCIAGNYAVFAMTNGNACSCGNSLPSTTSTSCNIPCTGYPSDICGGTSAYSVWLTGIGTLSGGSGLAAASVAKKSSTSTTSTTATSTPTSTTTPMAPTVIYVTTAVVQQGVTVIQTVSASTRASTPSASASSAAQSRASKSSKSGISGGAIAGIVIGVLALAAIGAVVAFLMLRRRNKKSEDFAGEYKRHIEPAGAGVTRQPSSLDNRLDTSLAVRRDSAESLADNQDYSRKILRVVN